MKRVPSTRSSDRFIPATFAQQRRFWLRAAFDYLELAIQKLAG